jgi:hypothetical protein
VASANRSDQTEREARELRRFGAVSAQRALCDTQRLRRLAIAKAIAAIGNRFRKSRGHGQAPRSATTIFNPASAPPSPPCFLSIVAVLIPH